MPLEKWVGRFLIDEGERLVKPQGRYGCSTYLTTQETFCYGLPRSEKGAAVKAQARKNRRHSTRSLAVRQEPCQREPRFL